MESEKRFEEQSLLTRSRSGSSSTDESYWRELERDDANDLNSCQSFPSRWKAWLARRCGARHRWKVAKAAYSGLAGSRRRRCFRFGRTTLLLHFSYFLLVMIIVCGVSFPSYAKPPQRYTDLRRRVEEAKGTGAANLRHEKVFIAASLQDKDGKLLSGHWGRSVLRLVNILGPENVFLSIYENDPDMKSQLVLDEFRNLAPCNSSIVQEHLDLGELQHITMADGSRRLKRMTFLAEVRNRALRPLDNVTSPAYTTRWDKLLFINDIAFNPIDAANLLFNTNVDETTGKTDYRAACPVDFVNPFKFYDTFATRDLEGYKMGLPFFPWFTNSGKGESRQDVLSETDAVRVSSCWSGMVAFTGKWFQPHLYAVYDNDSLPPTWATENVNPSNTRTTAKPSTTATTIQSNSATEKPTTYHNSYDPSSPLYEDTTASFHPSGLPFPPLRFRAEPDQYWDASECCLIHADLAHLPLADNIGPTNSRSDGEPGIYVNPYIRVAYSPAVLTWLPFAQRFERLYTPFQGALGWVVGMPRFNPRRAEQPGEEVIDRVWHWDDDSLGSQRNSSNAKLHGSYQEVKRIARPGQFCGSRKLLYIKHAQDGDGPWGSASIPRDY